MNMEIALLLAHLCLMPTAYEVRTCYFFCQSQVSFSRKLTISRLIAPSRAA